MNPQNEWRRPLRSPVTVDEIFGSSGPVFEGARDIGRPRIRVPVVAGVVLVLVVALGAANYGGMAAAAWGQ